MALFEGDRAYEDSDVISGGAGAAISAGEVVALDSSGYFLASDDGTDRFAPVGVAHTDAASGEVVSLSTQGACVANVASGLSAGVEVDVQTTGGQFGAVEDGPYVSLSAEGGEYRNQSVPAGHAVVLLK